MVPFATVTLIVSSEEDTRATFVGAESAGRVMEKSAVWIAIWTASPTWHSVVLHLDADL